MSKHLTPWLLVALITVVAMSGCANLPSGEPSAELGDTSKGVVAASLTYTSGTHTMDAWFYVRKKGESDKDQSVRLSANPPVLSGKGLLGLAVPGKFGPKLSKSWSQPGRVLAVALAPGEYELYSWQLYIQVMGGYGYISPKSPPPPLSFEVRAGQITYLGGLHAQTLMGKNVFGIRVPFSGEAVIEDQLTRDLPLIKEKFPMIQGWPMNSANLNGKAWMNLPAGQ